MVTHASSSYIAIGNINLAIEIARPKSNTSFERISEIYGSNSVRSQISNDCSPLLETSVRTSQEASADHLECCSS